jgi:hypothetical protein
MEAMSCAFHPDGCSDLGPSLNSYQTGRSDCSDIGSSLNSIQGSAAVIAALFSRCYLLSEKFSKFLIPHRYCPDSQVDTLSQRTERPRLPPAIGSYDDVRLDQ